MSTKSIWLESKETISDDVFTHIISEYVDDKGTHRVQYSPVLEQLVRPLVVQFVDLYETWNNHKTQTNARILHQFLYRMWKQGVISFERDDDIFWLSFSDVVDERTAFLNKRNSVFQVREHPNQEEKDIPLEVLVWYKTKTVEYTLPWSWFSWNY